MKSSRVDISNVEHALQNEAEEMVEWPRDGVVTEQPQSKKPKIGEKGGGSDFIDESDSYSERGGVYDAVMKEEDECETDEYEDEDEGDGSEEEDNEDNVHPYYSRKMLVSIWDELEESEGGVEITKADFKDEEIVIGAKVITE